MTKTIQPPSDTKAATRAVVAVSKGGRGFVVEGKFPNPLTSKPKGWRRTVLPTPYLTQRYIITAAHCLPRLPSPHRAAYTAEKTYKKLIGPLGTAPSIDCRWVI